MARISDFLELQVTELASHVRANGPSKLADNDELQIYALLSIAITLKRIADQLEKN